MTYQLPEKLRNLDAYVPVSNRCKVRMDANESFLNLPDEIRHEISVGVSRIEFNRYPDPLATELCEKFANYYHVPADAVVAANGSDELLFLLTTCFSDAGDVLLTVKPDFSMYGVYAELAGMQVAVYEKNDRLEIDADALIAAAKAQKAKMVIFSNPCNPSSLLTSKETVLRIVEGLPDCLVVVDEAYMEFAEGSVLQQVQDYANLLVLKTFSKAFGLAAARLGFAVSNQTIINALKAAKSPYNVNTMSQVVGSILLDHTAYIDECILLIKESRDALFGQLQALAGQYPQIKTVQNTRSNFVYVTMDNAAAACEALRAQDIAIRGYKDDHLRIAAGSEQENDAVVNALRDFLKGAD